MTTSNMPTANAENRGTARSFGNLFVFTLCLALPLMLFDVVDGVNFLGDIDDDLRAIQVRLLVEGASWFDRTIPMIQMPETYVSPWSRLVDLPYAAIAWVLSSPLGVDTALQTAFWIWPPIMLVLFCALMVKTQLSMLDGIMPLDRIGLISSLLLMWLALWEFSPGRIDHHNMQLLLIILTIWGLSLWTRLGAALVGIGSVASVAVGLELLPLIGLALGGVSLCWVLDRPGSREFAIVLGLSMLAATPLLGLALIGPNELASTQCDALSAPYAIALAGYGGITAALAAAPLRAGPIHRGVLLTAAGAALVGWLVWQYPVCLQGPYHMIDPLSRTLWLERVEQEKSFLFYYLTGNTAEIVMLGALAVVLVLAAPTVVATLKRGRSGIAIIYLCAVAALALALLQTRYIRFPMAMAPLFMPYVLYLVARNRRAGPRLLAATVAVVAGVGLTLPAWVHTSGLHITMADYLTGAACVQPQSSVLARVSPGRILMPLRQGLELIDRLPPGMSVAAVSFHRAAPGIRRVFQAFISPDSETRRKAVEGFDYIALCRLPMPASIAGDTLFAVVSRGGDWPGLTRLSGENDGFQLFRIDHAAFR